jgi:hypothetical protein
MGGIVKKRRKVMDKIYKTSFNLSNETKENIVKIQGIIQSTGKVVTKSEIVDLAIAYYLKEIGQDKNVLL